MNEPSNLLGAGTALQLLRLHYLCNLSRGRPEAAVEQRRIAASRRVPRQLNHNTSTERGGFFKADTPHKTEKTGLAALGSARACIAATWSRAVLVRHFEIEGYIISHAVINS